MGILSNLLGDKKNQRPQSSYVQATMAGNNSNNKYPANSAPAAYSNVNSQYTYQTSQPYPAQQQQQQPAGYPAQQQQMGYAPPHQSSGYGQPMMQHHQQNPHHSYGSVPQQPQQYGYSQSGPVGAQAAPMQAGSPEDAVALQWFSAADRNKNGMISAVELKSIFYNNAHMPFCDSSIKLLMSLFDRNSSGNIDANEFIKLWKYIQQWNQKFLQFDADRSGTISAQELGQALHSFGFKVEVEHVNCLVNHFKTSAAMEITFDSFIQCCVIVRNLFTRFNYFDHDKDGWVQMNHSMMIQVALGAIPY